MQVALRKYKWKDCKNPPGTKVASIVDQEGFRENVVFVVGKNGRLYQYNIVTQLWHEHYQSQHLVLSTSPGTAMRPLTGSLKGSLFMLSEDGGLVEYRWSGTDGWNWIEHGTPHTSVALVGAPGPCFGGTQFFLIGSDGSVYLRYLDQEEWKWRHCGFPLLTNENVGEDGEFADAMDKLCDPKVRGYMQIICFDLCFIIIIVIVWHFRGQVSSTRPVPFSEDSVIFELQDGRVSSFTFFFAQQFKHNK